MQPQPKILLIEDHADIRRLVRLTLEFEPFEILEAANAVEGWDVARAQKPQLILLDIMMPGLMNGLELCALMRADPQFKDTRIVILSALVGAAQREAGLQAGADAYLVKPFSPMALLNLVNRLLRQPATLGDA